MSSPGVGETMGSKPEEDWEALARQVAADLEREKQRSEERRVGKSVDLGGRRIIKKKKRDRKSVV